MKSQDQKKALWETYKIYNGQTPSKEDVKQLVMKLGLKANQIYKWFWNKKKRFDEYAQLASHVVQNKP